MGCPRGYGQGRAWMRHNFIYWTLCMYKKWLWPHLNSRKFKSSLTWQNLVWMREFWGLKWNEISEIKWSWYSHSGVMGGILQTSATSSSRRHSWVYGLWYKTRKLRIETKPFDFLWYFLIMAVYTKCERETTSQIQNNWHVSLRNRSDALLRGDQKTIGRWLLCMTVYVSKRNWGRSTVILVGIKHVCLVRNRVYIP